ncbi:unnamed protein product, partial [Mesorhabditis spiculigera]
MMAFGKMVVLTRAAVVPSVILLFAVSVQYVSSEELVEVDESVPDQSESFAERPSNNYPHFYLLYNQMLVKRGSAAREATENYIDPRLFSSAMGKRSAAIDDPRFFSSSFGKRSFDPRFLSSAYGKRGMDDPRFLSSAFGKRAEVDPRFLSSAFGKRSVDPRFLSSAFGKRSALDDPRFFSSSFGKRADDFDPRFLSSAFGKRSM